MPRKKALLIGINYTGSKHQLNGCINDAMNVREYLVRDRGYSPDQRDMVILTDAPENRGTPFFPTGANMLAAFKWLVSGNNPGDSLWLSYSGHGSMFSLKAVLCSGEFLTKDFSKAKFEIPMGTEILGMHLNHLDATCKINPVLTILSFDDTICPVDFEQNGQITSDTVRSIK
jgi:hypothetical protein